MPVAASGGAGNPLGTSIGERGAPIECRGRLEPHPGSTACDAGQKSDVDLPRSVFQQAVLELDAGCLQNHAAAGSARIRVAQRRDNSRYLRVHQHRRARRRATEVVAGLKGDVNRCARRLASRLLKRESFGVRLSSARMPAVAHHLSILDDDAADARVRRRGEQAFFRECERPRHHGVVELGERAHLRRLRGDFTSWTASRKSSGVSKLRYTEAKRM